LKPALFLTLLRRELRGSMRRVMFFVACLSIGVAAVVAVAGLADSVDRTIRREARPLLAADVAVTARRPLPEVLDEVPAELISGRAELREFSTMASRQAAEGSPLGNSQLVELKVVEGAYPFYGDLVLDPPQPLEALLGDDGVVVQPQLLTRLGLETGDSLSLGGEPFTIRGVVLEEPDRAPISLAPGPRVFLSKAGLQRTPLDSTTGRLRWKALFQTPDAASTDALVRWLDGQEQVSSWARIETWSDAQPAVRRGLSRAESFLGLVALLSLLVGGAGVAQVIRAWLARRMTDLATMRCLGMTPNQVARLVLGQTAALALLGSLVGAVLGTLCLMLVPGLLGDLLPPDVVRPFQPLAILKGAGLGTGVALLFAWLPLRQARRVPPLRVLRQDVEPLPDPPLRRATLGLILLLGVGVVSAIQAGSVLVGAIFTGVVAVVGGVLALGARGVATLLGRLGRSLPVWWMRHGLVALSRPGAHTLSAMTALGLGMVVVLGTLLIQDRLGAQLSGEFPEDAPSAFFLDVQRQQWDQVQTDLATVGAERVVGAPMVVGRLAAIDGVSTEELVRDMPDRERWAFTREQRLSFGSELLPHNRIIDGAWASDPDRAEVSVERRYAERLGVGVGSSLTYDVQGIPVDLAVTSIREVAWESFQMNFFLAVEEGVLEQAPHTYLVTAQVPESEEETLRDALAVGHPNVTMISVREGLERASGLLGRLGLAIRALGGFTALAGVLILLSSVSASTAQRARQVALFKTLGTTRLGVVGVLAVEYALVGLVAGLVGVVGANGLAWGVLTQLMELSWRFQPVLSAAGLVLCMLGVAAAGVAGNLGALRARPQEVLRGA